VTKPPLCTLEGVTLRHAGARRAAVDGVDLALRSGRVTALVGPSGSGKTSLALALLGLVPPGAVVRGVVRWRGESLDAAGRRRLLGRELALLPQDPVASLDPVWRVGDQLRETLRCHGVPRGELDARVASLLRDVQLPGGRDILRRYPHQLSGGQCQRLLLALALAGEPSLLLADEPTTNLDRPTADALLATLRRLVEERGLALLLITHDLAVAAAMADEVVVLDGGRIVERGAPDRLLGAPRAALTRELVTALGAPVPPPSARPDDAAPVLTARGLRWRPPGARHDVVRGVDLTVAAAERVALVGESGGGKTSLALLLAGLARPREGRVEIAGQPRRGPHPVQLVFQNPYRSLDPRQRCLDTVREAVLAAGVPPGRADEATAAWLRDVELPESLWSRRPHALSGGQRQRVALARALAARPLVLVADEPTSSQDLLTRHRLLSLLLRLQERHRLALLLVTHDLELARRHGERLLVVYGGVVVEECPASVEPRHPYSRYLWGEGTPDADRQVAAPATGFVSPGCPYLARCPRRRDDCGRRLPDLATVSPGHRLRCPVVREERPGTLG